MHSDLADKPAGAADNGFQYGERTASAPDTIRWSVAAIGRQARA